MKILFTLPVLAFAVSSALANDVPFVASVDTPPGSGYVWCDVSLSPQAKPLYDMSTASLMSSAMHASSAYIATSCVKVSGMKCDSASPNHGTLTTSLYWLRTHYLKYEKSGPQDAGTDHLFDCSKQTSGNVQVVVPYNFQVQCHVSQTPPADLQPAKGKVC